MEALEEIKQLKLEVEFYKQQVLALKDIIRILEGRKYGPQSEVVSSNQLGIFNEVEDIEAEDSIEEDEKETITYERKKRGGRTKIPDNLPRVDDVIDLPEAEKTCPHDGTRLKEVGEDVNEQIEIIPAKVQVIRTIRKKYACPSCEEGVKTAKMPPMLLPKSIATPSLIAAIITAKFADALPLYRQEQIFARAGALMTRQTMSRWLIEVSSKLVPLYNLLQDHLLNANYLQMDETRVQVLNEKGRKATTRSYMWVRYKPGEQPIVLYDYSPSRSGEVPKSLLEGFEGHLQVDGYDGYAAVCDDKTVIRLGCMDHCRRKFREAFKTSSGKGVGKKGLMYLKKLYKIEDRIKNYSAEKKYEVRQQESVPLLKEIKLWIDDTRERITPTSIAGKAINYAFNEWKYLTRYTEDGSLRISNILVENAIRPFALGRKNWLFSSSVDGANASAMYFSLIETAKANGYEPFDFLNRMLEALPHATELEDFEKLLPLKGKFQA